MQWVAPSIKDDTTGSLEQTLWDAADALCVKPDHKSQILGVQPKTSNLFISILRANFEPPPDARLATGAHFAEAGQRRLKLKTCTFTK